MELCFSLGIVVQTSQQIDMMSFLSVFLLLSRTTHSIFLYGSIESFIIADCSRWSSVFRLGSMLQINRNFFQGFVPTFENDGPKKLQMNLTSILVNFADALSSQVNSPILLLNGSSKSVSGVISGKRSEFRSIC